MTEKLYTLDLNTDIVNKCGTGKGDMFRMNMGFKTQPLTMRQVAIALWRGHAWTSPLKKVRHHAPKPNKPNYMTSYRVKANVINVTALGLDSDTNDERSSVDHWLSDPFVANNAGIIHTTSSHTEDKPRCRIIFFLSEPISVEDAELALLSLHARYPHVDQSAKDACRIFYGAKGCHMTLREDKVLDTRRVMSELVTPQRVAIEAIKAERQARMAERDQLPHNNNASAANIYVHSIVDNLVNELTTTMKGQGRHRVLITTCVRVASLSLAEWHSYDISAAWEGIRAASYCNGYLDDYGVDEVERAIESSFSKVTPAERPNIKSDFVGVGDHVEIVMPVSKRHHAGRVTAVRKDIINGWEIKLNGAWFAKGLVG